jgi:hypothetical protein
MLLPAPGATGMHEPVSLPEILKMKKLAFMACILLALSSTQAQSLKKYPIGNSGCSVYMYCDPGEFEISYSQDSATIFSSECEKKPLNYSVICVKLREPVAAGDDAEGLLISYLDYLKTAFHIKSSAGYGKGHTLEKKPEARGVIDYWNDADGVAWKVKGWTDGKFIAVLAVYGKGKVDITPKEDLFLNGFRFPGM